MSLLRFRLKYLGELNTSILTIMGSRTCVLLASLMHGNCNLDFSQ